MAVVSFTARCPGCQNDARWLNILDEHRRENVLRIDYCKHCDGTKPKPKLRIPGLGR